MATESPAKSRDVFTGFRIEEPSLIVGPNDPGRYWINDRNEIWGPINGGKYQVDNEGQILDPESNPTGFYITENRQIFGPSKELPWMK